MAALTKRAVRVFLVTTCVVLAASPAVQAKAVETFDGYAPHVNSTPFLPPYVPPASAPGEYVFWIYGDAPQNEERVASWSWDSAAYGGRANANDSAGIADDGTDVYAFSNVRGDNPGQGGDLGYMDFGRHGCCLTSGALADYIGVGGRVVHGGSMSARVRVQGFAARIQFGFVSNLGPKLEELTDGVNGVSPILDDMETGGHNATMPFEFEGPIVDVTDSFQWYHADFDAFACDYDGHFYGSSYPWAEAQGIWIRLYSNTASATLAGQLHVDQIEIIPEPATTGLVVLGVAAFGLFRRRRCSK